MLCIHIQYNPSFNAHSFSYEKSYSFWFMSGPFWVRITIYRRRCIWTHYISYPPIRGRGQGSKVDLWQTDGSRIDSLNKAKTYSLSGVYEPWFYICVFHNFFWWINVALHCFNIRISFSSPLNSEPAYDIARFIFFNVVQWFYVILSQKYKNNHFIYFFIFYL